MSDSVRDSIYEAISAIRLIDPHTHINPHSPASTTLADILGYHYYTELIHSAGMPREEIEEEGLHPKELVRRLVQGLPNIENTANYRWLIDICRVFFDFEDEKITSANWEALYDAAENKMNSAQWPSMVLDQSNVAAVFLTNDFDDDLEDFDSSVYIPCLRTDDLVFHLTKKETRDRLEACSGVHLDGSLTSLRAALQQRFEHFIGRGAKACAISLPPSFEPGPVSDGRAATALEQVLKYGTNADDADQAALSKRVFWTLAEMCDHYGLPFDLMIGVNRGVYPAGVYQGQDLYDSRVSLIQYKQLFQTFPDVKFPVSVLASVTNQELCSYAWIFPNVITNGHWWYSNTPSFIRRDAAARLEAVPRSKQIGYYSDAYKLEFVWPKFDMYRRVLADILSEEFVRGNGWSEERAIELGRQVLRDNVDEIFGGATDEETETDDVGVDPMSVTETVRIDDMDDDEDDGQLLLADDDVSQEADSGAGDILGVAGTGAALAAGAIGMVPVQDDEPSYEEPEPEGALDDVEVIEPEGYEGGYGDDTEEEMDNADTEETVQDIEEAGVAQWQSADISGIAGVYEDPMVDPNQETVQIEDDESEGIDLAESTPVQSEMFDTVNEDAFPDMPTTVDSLETVEIDEELEAQLDPLPSEDEVQGVDLEDVELRDDGVELRPEPEDIAAVLDDEPLDVGDLTDGGIAETIDEVEEIVETQSETPIEYLRGEGSFTPDEDSLQLSPDPMTGELTFQPPGTEDVSSGSVEIDETIEWEDDDQ